MRKGSLLGWEYYSVLWYIDRLTHYDNGQTEMVTEMGPCWLRLYYCWLSQFTAQDAYMGLTPNLVA